MSVTQNILFEPWLKKATDGLTRPVRERIRLEVEAHVADSVERHVEDGLSEIEALVATVSELGDAEAAARRFRRRYLTEKDAEHVKQTLLLFGGGINLIGSIFLDGVAVLELYLTARMGSGAMFNCIWAATVVLMVWTVSATTSWLLARRERFVRNTRWMMLFNLIDDACYFAITISLSAVIAAEMGWMGWLFCIPQNFMFLRRNRSIRVCFKLWRGSSRPDWELPALGKGYF
ncbi:MAG TPA: hypothetical protein VGO67_18340 [Verrucomicrobiae bacterium]|jgi:hypothetical protein